MMLFYTKVEKFGMISIMSVLVAIIMFITGMGYLGAPLIIMSGVLADLIAKSGQYKDIKKTVISFGVFCIWITGNYIHLVFSAASYKEGLIEEGFSQEYCDFLFFLLLSSLLVIFPLSK